MNSSLRPILLAAAGFVGGACAGRGLDTSKDAQARAQDDGSSSGGGPPLNPGPGGAVSLPDGGPGGAVWLPDGGPAGAAWLLPDGSSPVDASADGGTLSGLPWRSGAATSDIMTFEMWRGRLLDVGV